jgi:hypothetical protein|tara:strand:+ start:228 stop:449 length:222 start_codon:yes stop_codon:yes gene_type:complete
MKKIKNKNRLKKTQERNKKRKLKEKQRREDFYKVKLARKAEKTKENKAENETFKMQREIQKIQNRGTQIKKGD